MLRERPSIADGLRLVSATRYWPGTDWSWRMKRLFLLSCANAGEAKTSRQITNNRNDFMGCGSPEGRELIGG